MGVFDKLKIWYDCKKSGRTEEYKEYKKMLELQEEDIERISGYVENATQRFESIKLSFSPDSKEYKRAETEMHRWEQSLDEFKLQMEFMRPNKKEDIEYRDKQSSSFVAKLQEVLPPDLDLRFHGTQLCFAREILKTGVISSTADRYDGYIKSTDRKGEISASNIRTLQTTISFFSDLAGYIRCAPAGCIFALLPKDKEDAEYGENLLKTVDFKQNPEQLFGIFTSPENIEQVQRWVTEAKLNPDLVYTFEGFLQAVKSKSTTKDRKANFAKKIGTVSEEELEVTNTPQNSEIGEQEHTTREESAR